jgi:predicted PurR-regulated permease PerM
MNEVPLQDPTGRTASADPPPTPLSYRDLRRVMVLAFGLYLLLQFAEPLTTLLLSFLLVFILAAVLNPIVVAGQARGIPRIGTTLGIVVGVVALFTVLGYLMMPPLFNEVGNFVEKLSRPGALDRYHDDLARRAPWLAKQLPEPATIIQNFTANLSGIARQAGRYTATLAGAILSLFLLLVLVIYTTVSPTPLVVGLLGAVPANHRPRAVTALRRILVQLKNWASGSVTLGVIVGVMTGVGLMLVGRLTGHAFPYILLFSVIAGVGELLPNIGPIISAVPPILIALTIDPWLALWVAVLFLVIQQAENNLIVPYVMGQSLNLHPVSVMFTVLVMGLLFGLLGAVLAVPVCAIVKICWEEFYLVPRATDSAALQILAEEIVASSAPTPRVRKVRAAKPQPDEAAPGSANTATPTPPESPDGGR